MAQLFLRNLPLVLQLLRDPVQNQTKPKPLLFDSHFILGSGWHFLDSLTKSYEGLTNNPVGKVY